jgi:hypothetical protein
MAARTAGLTPPPPSRLTPSTTDSGMSSLTAPPNPGSPQSPDRPGLHTPSVERTVPFELICFSMITLWSAPARRRPRRRDQSRRGLGRGRDLINEKCETRGCRRGPCVRYASIRTAASSRSRKFCTLPVGVLGSSSTISRLSGYFWRAMPRPSRKVVRCQCRVRARAGDDHGAATLHQSRIRYRHHGDVRDVRVGVEEVLHLLGADVLSAAQDDVLGATGDRHVAGIVDRAAVTCVVHPSASNAGCSAPR